jgi:hypothetical protein
MQARKGSVEIRQKIMGTVAVAPHSFRPPGSGEHLDLGFQDLVHGGCVSALKVVGAVFILGWDLGLESASQIEIN